jgi:hypothetical protein
MALADPMRMVLALYALLWGKCHPTNTEWIGIPSPRVHTAHSAKGKGVEEGVDDVLEEIIGDNIVEQ